MAENMVTIYVMGKPYEVPGDLTIMKAMEYAGYRFVRGCGCRGAFCGACGTVYRTKDDYRLKVGLACQEMVQDEMYLAEIPFFPGNKAIYDIEELQADVRGDPQALSRGLPLSRVQHLHEGLSPGHRGHGVHPGRAPRGHRQGRRPFVRLPALRAVRVALPGRDRAVQRGASVPQALLASHRGPRAEHLEERVEGSRRRASSTRRWKSS